MSQHLNQTNEVTLVGNVAHEPNNRKTKNGNNFCYFSISNQISYYSNGNEHHHKNYFNIQAFGKPASSCKDLVKNQRVTINGQLWCSQNIRSGKIYHYVKVHTLKADDKPKSTSKDNKKSHQVLSKFSEKQLQQLSKILDKTK